MGEDFSCLIVGQVSQPTSDTRLQEQRIGALLQHCRVVIALEHERVQSSERSENRFRTLPRIG